MNKQLYETIGRLTVELSNKENELAEWKEKHRQLEVSLQLERYNFKAYTDPIWDYSYQPDARAAAAMSTAAAMASATTDETEEEFNGNIPNRIPRLTCDDCDNEGDLMSPFWREQKRGSPLVRQTCDDDTTGWMETDSTTPKTTPPPLVRNKKIYNTGVSMDANGRLTLNE
jgi:hypothetical protein